MALFNDKNIFIYNSNTPFLDNDLINAFLDGAIVHDVAGVFSVPNTLRGIDQSSDTAIYADPGYYRAVFPDDAYYDSILSTENGNKLFRIDKAYVPNTAVLPNTPVADGFWSSIAYNTIVGNCFLQYNPSIIILKLYYLLNYRLLSANTTFGTATPTTNIINDALTFASSMNVITKNSYDKTISNELNSNRNATNSIQQKVLALDGGSTKSNSPDVSEYVTYIELIKAGQANVQNVISYDKLNYLKIDKPVYIVKVDPTCIFKKSTTDITKDEDTTPIKEDGGITITDPVITTSTNPVIYHHIFKNDIQEDEVTPVSKTVWPCNETALMQFYTSSVQTDMQKRYYIEVWNSESIDLDCQSCQNSGAQFTISYGNKYGSGSILTNYDYPTKAIYSQYKSLLLEPTDTHFTIGGVDKSAIFAINCMRSSTKDKLDEGNWELNLRVGSKVLRLIDDSGDSDGESVDAKLRYNVVSGSIMEGIHNPDTPHVYGLFYPDMGIIILDADHVNSSGSLSNATNLGLTISTGSNVENNNHLALLDAIRLAATSSDLGFLARSVNKVISTNYYLHIKHDHFNFSNNPTFANIITGDLLQQSMKNDTTTYISTIGLYDDYYRLIALGKLSKPLIKNFETDYLLKVKLNYL